MDIKDLHKILVSVETSYQEKQSNPTAPYYFFGYTIRIQNNYNAPIKLLTRHWEIHDLGADVETVDGEGVIGKQPIIKPGEEYSYNSFCHLKSPFGKMSGHYTFEDFSDGTYFSIPTPTLLFQYPIALN